MNNAHLLELFRSRLKVICDKRGSVAEVSKDTGINRTQLHRYLSGESIPKINVISILSETYKLPVGWFFSPEPDHKLSVSEHEIGDQFSNLFAGRNFQLSENEMETGFALFWKARFTQNGYYEAILSQIKQTNSVCTIRSSMISTLKKENAFAYSDPIDHFCNGILLKSGAGCVPIFSDTAANILVTGYIEKRLVAWSSSSFYAGYLVVHANLATTAGGVLRDVVPVVFEMLPQNTKSILAAARRKGLYQYDELPNYIKRIFDGNQLPEKPVLQPTALGQDG